MTTGAKVSISSPTLIVQKNGAPPFKMIIESDTERYRYDTFWTKEPETIAWINDMKAGEVLYDVGANIGVYTLYAASRGVNVVAFEPVLENYMRLVQNIELNGYNNIIPIYGAVAAFKQTVLPMSIKSKEYGASGSQLVQGNGYDPVCIRHVPCYSLDEITLPYHPPHYVKIDVDGFEIPIFCGMFKLFAFGDRLPSYLIELANIEMVQAHNGMMSLLGFTHENKYNRMTPHSRDRRQAEGIQAVNMIYTRVILEQQPPAQ